MVDISCRDTFNSWGEAFSLNSKVSILDIKIQRLRLRIHMFCSEQVRSEGREAGKGQVRRD